MRSGWAPVAALVLLSACEKPEIKACEAFLKDGLRSPATYRRVGVSSYDGPINEQAREQLREEQAQREASNPEWAALMKDLDAETPASKQSLREVFIEYDAENAYGTPIRGAQKCGFVMRNGELPSASSLRAKASAAQSSRSLRQLRGDESEPAYSCCL